MTDVFLSYKREDRQRVQPLADALSEVGLDVWWDRDVEGGASWRQSIIQRLETAKCVIVVWSEASVSAAADFVHDEASRAKSRGILLPVKIDHVEPPIGFGEIQVLDLVGWRGSANDGRFKDVVAAARAIIEGGPRPRPTAPGSRFRLAAFATTTIAIMAGVIGFLADVAGLQEPICRTAFARSVCAQNGWGGIATPAEQTAWEGRSPGDCEGLRTFIAAYPDGVYAEEAARRLQAAVTRVDENWRSETRRLPMTVRSNLTALPNEAAARADAIHRSQEDAQLVCGSYAGLDGYRLAEVRAEPKAWRCPPLGSGVTCGFDGEAVCSLEVRSRAPREICP